MNYKDIIKTKETYLDNKYSRIYFKIIEKRLDEPSLQGEKHHILPKSLFPEYTKSTNNIVKLSHREHFICHRLLIKMFTFGSEDFRKMSWAIHRMSKKYTIDSKEYSAIRKIHITNLSLNKGRKSITNGKINKFISQYDTIPDGWRYGITRTKEHEEKLRLHRQNRTPLTEETKQKISKSNKGKTGGFISVESRNKISKALKGRNITWGDKLKEGHQRRKEMIERGLIEPQKPYTRTIEQRKNNGKNYELINPEGQVFTITNLSLFAEQNSLCKNALVKSYTKNKPVPPPKNKFTPERIKSTGWVVRVID